ncbi:ATP-binding protein [Actinoplanes sp. NPDC049316]|uniref:ATP-binding protein n=1 Tax=Actinoplanes sp. NPDC049316 TaxID=3154727 RepID=UPI003435ACA4
MGVETLVQADVARLIARVSGVLDLTDTAPLRNRLLKCLAEQPEALLVDLAQLTLREPLALAVFSAVARQAARWPAIPVALCAPRPEIRRSLGLAAYRNLPVYASVQAARDGLPDHRETLRVLTDELLPITGAARQARNVATEACLLWDLPDLVAPASLIASELVSNVIDHAGTMMTLRMTLRRRYLQISVSDGSSEVPALQIAAPAHASNGRGLMLVDATAHAWGWLPCNGGKVVWASLRTA